jgi:S1-C subfamily serine protease
MRLWDKIALIALVVFAIISKYAGDDTLDPGSGSARRPDPGQFIPAPPQRPQSADEPGLLVPVGDKQSNSSGTAFSVDSGGVWITARHVADGCDKIVLQKSGRQFVKVRGFQHHPNADISILWTRNGVPALPLLQQPLRPNQDGYSFGFPKGEPGDVYARMIGTTKMHQRGRYRTNEPVVAWTHVRRVPDRGAHLGGISGGPWLNSAGRILGVHVAGNPRRGRSYATAPSSLRAAYAQAGVSRDAAGRNMERVSVTPRNFPSVGNELRRSLTVAKVLCLVGDRYRTSRRRF